MKIEMPYRPLGRCGTKVSLLSLGGWTTYGGSVKDAKLTTRILCAAYEAGVNFFDMADIYSGGECERSMGRALKGIPRSRLVLSTKLFWPMSDDPNDRGLSRKHVMESVERSLKRMGTDYIDLYFCHRFDPDTPVEETARAMDDLIRQGKVLYWGTSEWTGAQIRDACELCEKRGLYRPQVEQPQYNLLCRAKFEKDVRPALERWGMGAVVWSPLASGLLTGKYDDGVPKGSRLSRHDWLRQDLLTRERIEKVKALKGLADRYGVTRAQLAIAWAASRPGVSSVILGATSVQQLEENLASLKVRFDGQVSKELEAEGPVAA